MIIPGFLISLITFPGVIVHEIAHQLMCRLCRVAVLDVCYFRTGNPSGYVIHEKPKSAAQNILIGVGPFLINTIIAALIALPVAVPIIRFNQVSPLGYFLMWLSVSIAMHSFPSTGDAKSIWNSVKEPSTNILLKIFAAPIVLIIYVLSFGSVVWLDAIYGIFIATLIPNLIIQLLV